jgi:hypothetical protein
MIKKDKSDGVVNDRVEHQPLPSCWVGICHVYVYLSQLASRVHLSLSFLGALPSLCGGEARQFTYLSHLTPSFPI